MAKAAILVPYLEMCELARSLVGTYPGITPICVEFTQTDRVVARACELERQGCELIVARGTQASAIRQNVRLPVVELCVTTQELAAVMLELKRELGAERPRLGLIGFANMLCDTSQFDQLFGICLQSYMVQRQEELDGAVEQALRDGCQGVVGGDIVCGNARRRGIPSRFLPAGAESMRNALEAAENMCYAIDLAKHNSAEMDAMLNHTFSGIMQVDRNGVIRRVNRAGYNLLGQQPGTLLGCPAVKALPSLNPKTLEDTLLLGKEAYAFAMDVNRRAVIMSIAPIRIDGQTEGAILTFQEGQRVIEMGSELRRELYQRGLIAREAFRNFVCCSKETAAAVGLAKRIAKYAAPVLLTGENGCGKGILAQCIHNESLLRGNAFVPLDCSAWQPETLDTMLFGNRYTTRRDPQAGMAELAQDGTLYLSHVEALPPESQYKLLHLIRGKLLLNGADRPGAANVRVIASTAANLAALVEKSEFRADLYYALSVLTVELLPLRRRREDIPGWVGRYLDEWQERTRRYVNLTQGAQDFLREYDWPGNLDQLNSVCERIVLLTEKRTVDEVFLKKQLEQISPRLLPGTEKVVLYKDQRAAQIAELLRKHGGSREKVAAELGVSKTTLWRYIKKYGIEPDFSY